eukprot:3940835-Rhodomonas_salina.3
MAFVRNNSIPGSFLEECAEHGGSLLAGLHVAGATRRAARPCLHQRAERVPSFRGDGWCERRCGFGKTSGRQGKVCDANLCALAAGQGTASFHQRFRTAVSVLVLQPSFSASSAGRW